MEDIYQFILNQHNQIEKEYYKLKTSELDVNRFDISNPNLFVEELNNQIQEIKTRISTFETSINEKIFKAKEEVNKKNINMPFLSFDQIMFK